MFWFFMMMLASIAFTLAADAAETQSVLILNMADEEVLPRNFRTCKSPYMAMEGKAPSREGLDNLNISGSAQFSRLSLRAIQKAANPGSPFSDIDLRQENHGFLNGAAISLYAPQDWGNRGKPVAVIQREQKEWLDKLRLQKEVTVGIVEVKTSEGIIAKTLPRVFKVESVMDEQQVADEAKAGYLRLYVTDHLAPIPEDVDSFMQYILKLPAGAWTHIHCAAGDGRTTTFMTIVDMMHNAKKVALEDIVTRQHLIGGIDLFRKRDPAHWKFPYAKEREDFIRKFYSYARTNNDTFKTSWSSYLNSQKKG